MNQNDSNFPSVKEWKEQRRLLLPSWLGLSFDGGLGALPPKITNHDFFLTLATEGRAALHHRLQVDK